MENPPKVRIKEPQRDGKQIVVTLGEDTLPPEHPARLLWNAFGRLDLSRFVQGAKAVQGTVGRQVNSPRMILTLWGLAFVRGIVHARKIERLLSTDLEFRWVSGDTSVSHTALSDFLVLHRHAMLELFTDVLAALMAQRLLFLPSHRLTQDGTKIRADASRVSFRTTQGLGECREQAELHLKAVMAQLDEPPLSARSQRIREQVAQDCMDRIEQATQAVKILQEQRANSHQDKKKQKEPRASTTDPDARVMKMAEGQYAPAYNIQQRTVGDPHGGPIAVVALRVTQIGNDQNSLVPLQHQMEQSLGLCATQVLADAQHATHQEIQDLAHVDLRIPRPKRWKPTEKVSDPAIQAWQQRNETPEAKEIYRGRKALAERTHARWTQFGLDRLPVRGIDRVETFMRFASVVLNILEFGPRWLN